MKRSAHSTKTTRSILGKVALSFIFLFLFYNFRTVTISPIDNNSQDFSLFVDTNDDSVYIIVDEMPEFVGGEEALKNYLTHNLIYPDFALENRIQGKLIIEFIVTKDGSIRDAKVIKQLGWKCDEEGLRLVNNMPKWKPGKEKGENVNVRCQQSIRFNFPWKKWDSLMAESYFLERELDTLSIYDKGRYYFIRDLAKKYKLPENIPDTIKGTVWFNVYLDKNGEVDSVDVFDCPNKEIAREIVSAISKLHKWEPAIYKGHYVRSRVLFIESIRESKIVVPKKEVTNRYRRSVSIQY